MLNNNGDTLLQIILVWGITFSIYSIHSYLYKKHGLELDKNKHLSIKRKIINILI